MKFKLLHGDCLEKMRVMPSKSVDLVITSPPYNMNLRINKQKYVSRQIVKEISTKYNGFSDNLPMEDYFNFHKNCLTEMLRVSNLVFWNVQQITGNKPALYRLLGHFHKEIKDVIIWNKINNQPAMKFNVLNSQFEFIFVFGDNPISRQFSKATFPRGRLSNVWDIPIERSKSKAHGAVFPERLVTDILNNFSCKGDTILDPFMGSGTTGFICRKLRRNFIGIEQSREYFEFSKNRIKSFGE